MRFRPLFKVNISHTYYNGGCKDFDFVFPADSVRLLANGRLVCKELDGELHVLFEGLESTASETPLVTVTGATLRIGLKLRNPYFRNFTNLDFDPRENIPLYRNAMSPPSLDEPQLMPMVGQIIRHTLSASVGDITVRLEDPDGRVLQEDVLKPTANRLDISYDLLRRDPGLYLVSESHEGMFKKNSYYVDPELQQTGVFGILEIRIDEGLYAAPVTFTVTFTAKEQMLKYYVVGRNYADADLDPLSVVDGGSSQVNFTKVRSSAFTADELPAALLTTANAKLVLFKSQMVARQETPRKKIQLKRNGETLIDNLPQPDMSKPNSDIIIQLSK